MKIAVRYYTKTGNTKRLAEAIGKAVGAEAQPISVPITEAVDILFLGNSYYAFTIDPEVRSFVLSLDKGKVGKIVNFGSAAMMNSTWKIFHFPLKVFRYKTSTMVNILLP